MSNVLILDFHNSSSALKSWLTGYLVGSWIAKYGEMSQARFTLSFHCFSVRLMYLDLQLAMLVSTDCSMEMASSWVDRGLYHVIRRSISLAWNDKHQWRAAKWRVVLKRENSETSPAKPATASCVSCSTCEAVSLCCSSWRCLHHRDSKCKLCSKTFDRSAKGKIQLRAGTERLL